MSVAVEKKYLECLNDTFTLDYMKGFLNVNDQLINEVIGLPIQFEKMEPYLNRLAMLSGKPLADHALIMRALRSLKLASWNIAGWGLKSPTADWYFHKFLNIKDVDGKDTSETLEQWKNRMGRVLEIVSIIFSLYNIDVLCIEEGPTFLDFGLTGEQRAQAIAVLAWFKCTAQSKGFEYVHYDEHVLDPLGLKMGQGYLVRVADRVKLNILSVEKDVEINNQVFKAFVEKFKTSKWFNVVIGKARMEAMKHIKDQILELTNMGTLNAKLALEEIKNRIDDQALRKLTDDYMFTLRKMCAVCFNQTAIINIHGKWGLNPDAYAWIVKAKGDLVMKEFGVQEVVVIGDYNIHASDMEKSVSSVMPSAEFFTTDPVLGGHSGGGSTPPKGDGMNKENIDLLITWTC